MKLRRLSTTGVRGLPDRTFELTDRAGRAQDLVLVTGRAGSGKTSLLEAVVAAKEDIGRYGALRPPGAVVRAGVRTARIEAVWELSSAEVERSGARSSEVTSVSTFGEGAPPLSTHDPALSLLLGSYSADPEKGKVAYFHAERMLPASRVEGAGPGTPDDGRLALTTSNEKYRPTRQFIVDGAFGDAVALTSGLREQGVLIGAARGDAAGQLGGALRKLLVDRAFDGVDRIDGSFRVRFVGRDGGVVDMDELSAGARQAVLFAVAFLRGGLQRSVVLVDTPELHVHPEHQPAFLAGLAALGVDNQILAATSSPALLRSASAAGILDLGSPSP